MIFRDYQAETKYLFIKQYHKNHVFATYYEVFFGGFVIEME